MDADTRFTVPHRRKNLLTDEWLVCLAFTTAITTGREVVILTKDADILEQSYKLQWLLDTLPGHALGRLLFC